MGGAESGMVGAIALGAISQLVVSMGLFLWGRWVARRQGTRFWHLAAWAPLAALVLALVGVATSVILLVRAFGAVATVEASRKATVLAESISEAMNASAMLVVPSWLLYLGSMVAFVIGTVARPRPS